MGRFEKFLAGESKSPFHDVKSLGKGIFLYTPKTETKKKILVIGGVHGTEPVGVHAIQKCLGDEKFSKISFIPCFCVWGIKHNKKIDKDGLFPNSITEKKLAPETKIFLETKELIDLGKDIFYSIHEDKEEKSFYLYANEPGKTPSKFVHELLDIGGKHFDLRFQKGECGKHSAFGQDEKMNLVDGIFFNNDDGTLDSYMHDKGSKLSLVSETPIGAPLKKRLDCVMDLLERIAKVS